MDERDLEQEQQGQTPRQEPIKWATPMQRLWAWVGVVYMVILVLLTTYALARGAYLGGIAGIMLAPALAGLGGSVILRYREGYRRGGPVVCVLLAGAAFGLAIWNLIQAVPNLLSQL